MNILMNAEMAKAILDGRKTQTRRVIKNKIYNIENGRITYSDIKNMTSKTHTIEYFINKYSKYKRDEEIWVREPAIVTNYISRYNSTKIDYQLKSNIKKQYRIDLPNRFFPNPKKWITNCQSVPNGCIKEMARIFLKITDVRVEKLQDICANGIEDEGYHISIAKKIGNCHEGMSDWWINLWNKTAPTGYKWEDNPYVFVYEFKKVNSDGSEMCK